MKVGDLVRAVPLGNLDITKLNHRCATPVFVEDRQFGIPETGIIVDFVEYDSEKNIASDIDRFAIVFWSEHFPAEEEYLDQIEVVNEGW